MGGVDAWGSPREERVLGCWNPGRPSSADLRSVRPLRPRQPTCDPPLLDTGAVPRAEVVPDDLTFRFPAHRTLAGSVGSAIQATIALNDRSLAAGTYLEAAAVMLAKAIILHARPWTPLQLSIAVDDTDAYVRLSAELLDRDEPPQFGEHVRATLRRNVASHELVQECGTVLAVLQVPLEPSVRP